MKKIAQQLISIAVVILLTSGFAMASVVADYWFEGPSGEDGTLVLDHSGNGNHGTLVGFTNTNVGYADNPLNPGYTADGMIRLVQGDPVEYVKSGVSAYNFITNSFTIEAITGLSPGGKSYWQPLVGHVAERENDWETFVYWGAGRNSAPHWHIVHGGPGDSYDDYAGILNDGNLHHYAITYDADSHEMKMYLDYQLIATVYADLSNAVLSDDPGVLFIGSHMGESSWEVWNGLIDRIRFSDEALTPDEFIQANPVPIPAAAWLLGSGLLGLVAMRRRSGKV